ncbi:unnamed protein product [Mycena citricolor]|uniref:Oligopeptide transporter n=1 Tax=Mycena citricolor TaxID=2018698 RepID=A0AAD2HM73_9AGAR|nr:unnamed protein product [Mycena citricolor]
MPRYEYQALSNDTDEAEERLPLKSAIEGDESSEAYELVDSEASSAFHAKDGIHDGLVRPTAEDEATLRRISDVVPWSTYLIAIVELAERFSVYGSGAVLTNFIQHPLPPGSITGAGLEKGQSGALGKGQRMSTAIMTFTMFWVSLTPMLGAYIADVHLGRFKTICYAVGIALIGHIILIFAAVPGIIDHADLGLTFLLVSQVVIGLGTGLFKANISPLVAEQYKKTKSFVIRLPGDGERVIVDPKLTVSRIYMYFYLVINIGALLGQFSMTYTEKYLGYWPAFALPTAVFLLCPLILFLGRNRYVRSPPSGSVLFTFIRLMRFGSRRRWSLNPFRMYANFTRGDFWETVTPSRIPPAKQARWMKGLDDTWVTEVRRGLGACAVFAWFPLYWLTMSQMSTNLISQAATLRTDGLPNDLLTNIDPLTLVLVIPLCDLYLYPLLQRRGIKFLPIRRITVGFFIACSAMIWCAVLQYNIYRTNPCGTAASTCVDGQSLPLVSPMSVWLQAPSYLLIAVSEIFASITVMEYSFTKAPVNMRSLVMALLMGTSAVSAVLGEGFIWLSADPFLVWNYLVMAGLAGAGGIGFWVLMRGLDEEELDISKTRT